jgi:5-methylthioadenosine/S-adenosylhomocysteine deaminase
MNIIYVSESRKESQETENRYKLPVKNGFASYLDSLGVLNQHTIAAHCLHLTEDDIAAFKKTRASIASCPISNLKVGMGVADLPKLISNGIIEGLGTDGHASNNTLDMFETMKMASLLPKGIQGDTTLMNARQAFETATLGGAKSMLQEKKTGSIAVGKRADVAILDLKSPNSFPFYDSYAHPVFSARTHDVRDVIVNGRILTRNRKILAIDVEKLEEVNKQIVSLGFRNP